MPIDASIYGGLRTFEVVARLLSFTKAASALNVTQSAVSQQIRHLEDRLNFPLFLRNRGGLSLTQHGLALFETTSLALQDIEQTLARLSSKATVLQISCLPSFALQWLMPRLSDFHQVNPGQSVRLKAEFHALDRHAMRAGNIDVAIRFDPRDYREMHAEPILDEYLVPVATAQYLNQHPEFAAGRTIAGVTLLHDGMPWEGAPEFIEWRTWLEAARPEWLPSLGGVQFNLSSLAIGAAQNHQGVAMARTAQVMDEIRSGQLVNIFDQSVPAPARYVLLTELGGNPDVERFSKWIKEECRRFKEVRDTLFSI